MVFFQINSLLINLRKKLTSSLLFSGSSMPLCDSAISLSILITFIRSFVHKLNFVLINLTIYYSFLKNSIFRFQIFYMTPEIFFLFFEDLLIIHHIEIVLSNRTPFKTLLYYSIFTYLYSKMHGSYPEGNDLKTQPK